MSEDRWVSESKRVLKKLMEHSQDGDRLNLMQSMLFSLQAMHRSLLGWLQWVGNPNIMAKFSAEELGEMNAILKEQTKSFLEFDIKVTEKSPVTPMVKGTPRTRFEI